MFLVFNKKSFDWFLLSDMTLNNRETITFGHTTVGMTKGLHRDHRAMLAIAHTIRLFHFEEVIELALLNGFAQESEHVSRIASRAMFATSAN
jgi:hypothetical protein